MKKDLKTEITKEKILKAATEEFSLYGFDGATVNQICQKHGISKGLIYHNFENKEELYLRCVEEAVNEFVSYMSRREFGTDFKLYMKERYAFFEAHPNYSRLIFAVVLTDDTGFAERIKKIKSNFDEFNRNIYLTAIQNIRLRKGISEKDALEYYSLLQDMLNGYLPKGRAEEDHFESVFLSHE
ncbi:MAG: TetR/AcrR family transcriptional regulator, partial [Oscillospiraceae bacterium]|nr:TetR/AcrR family transcriptional regulator [Oscillospiraceae bacterium]